MTSFKISKTISLQISKFFFKFSMIIYNLYQYMIVSFVVMNLYMYIFKKKVHITYQNSFLKFSMIIYNFFSYFRFVKGEIN